MNPFDLPPTTPPVSADPPPSGSIEPGRSRGRLVVAAVAAAGLMGVGLVGVSQLVSADRPEVEGVAATPDDDTEPIDPVDEGDDGEPDPADGDAPSVDGEIVIDTGDGEPIVIDLGEGTINGDSLDSLAECVGLPPLGDVPMLEFDIDPEDFPFDPEDYPFDELDDLPLGELMDELERELGEFEGELGEFDLFGADGTHITVVGPDGVSVVDLGEGDGSVTISRSDGELSITTDGDATVEELPDLVGGLEELDLGELDLGELDRSELEEAFDSFDAEELFGEDFFDEFPMFDMEGGEFEPLDPSKIEGCLDDLRNG